MMMIMMMVMMMMAEWDISMDGPVASPWAANLYGRCNMGHGMCQHAAAARRNEAEMPKRPLHCVKLQGNMMPDFQFESFNSCPATAVSKKKKKKHS